MLKKGSKMITKLKSNIKWESLKLQAVLPVFNITMKHSKAKVISIEPRNIVLLETLDNSFVAIGTVIKAVVTYDFAGNVELKYCHPAKVADRLCK